MARQFDDVRGRAAPHSLSLPDAGRELSMVIEDAGYTAWVRQPLVKEKSGIDAIGEFATAPKCDVAEVDRTAAEMGERGIVRGHVCCFDVFGQPGCWQDACAWWAPKR